MPSYNLSVQPTQLAHLDSEQEVTIRVLGAGTVLLAQSLNDCQNGVGISYTSADNLQKQKWTDEMWATCDDPTTKVQIVFPAQGNSPSYGYTPNSRNSIVKLLVDGARKQSTNTCDKSLSLKSAFSKLIGRNVFKLLLFALLARNLYSQTDVTIQSSASQFTKVATSVPWSSIGNFRYIVTPSSSSAYLCTYIVNNNTTSAAALALNALGTGDTSTSTFLSKIGRWSSLSMTNLATGQFSNQTISNLSIGASSTITEQIQTSSAAHVVLYLSGTSGNSGSPDTVDIYTVSSVQPCGTNQFFGSTGPSTVIACDKTASFQIGSGNTREFVQPITGAKIYVCAYEISEATIPTLFLPVEFAYGTGASCSVGQVIFWWIYFNNIAIAPPVLQGTGLGQIFTTPISQKLCVINQLTDQVYVNVTYAQI